MTITLHWRFHCLIDPFVNEQGRTDAPAAAGTGSGEQLQDRSLVREK
jgi:hypothetical protein